MPTPDYDSSPNAATSILPTRLLRLLRDAPDGTSSEAEETSLAGEAQPVTAECGLRARGKLPTLCNLSPGSLHGASDACAPGLLSLTVGLSVLDGLMRGETSEAAWRGAGVR